MWESNSCRNCTCSGPPVHHTIIYVTKPMETCKKEETGRREVPADGGESEIFDRFAEIVAECGESIPGAEDATPAREVAAKGLLFLLSALEENSESLERAKQFAHKILQVA